MTGFVLFALIYFIFCTLFFEVIQKPFFGLYNRHVNAEKTTAKDIAQVYSHGLRLRLHNSVISNRTSSDCERDSYTSAMLQRGYSPDSL